MPWEDHSEVSVIEAEETSTLHLHLLVIGCMLPLETGLTLGKANLYS